MRIYTTFYKLIGRSAQPQIAMVLNFRRLSQWSHRIAISQISPFVPSGCRGNITQYLPRSGLALSAVSEVVLWVDDTSLARKIQFMASANSKRRRLDSPTKPRKKQRKQASGLDGQKAKTVGLDALPWSQVKLPDRLDDAEGFFGLEEISDVEVVRDQKLGKVEYRVGEGSANC